MDMKYSTGMALEIIWKDNRTLQQQKINVMLINDHQLFCELELLKLTK